MLQINSGKLYSKGVGRKNHLRGVLYSNLTMAGLQDTPIVTKAGTLLAAETMSTPASIVYELTEQMEDGRILPGVLVSHGVQPYLQDFAAVVAFALNVTCTPDYDICSRLLSGKRSIALGAAPPKLIKRVFDPEVWCHPADSDFLVTFVKDLIGLRRVSFRAAMRAVRTYVTGLHRISDDVELAYTLLVVSIESLAQSFDDHNATWADVEIDQRKRIDKALARGDPGVADEVRAALITGEYRALSRRFRNFAIAHISPTYFRETGRVGRPGRLDLRDALKEAYKLRSRYVHNLSKLPDLLSTDMRYAEVIRAEHTTFLTLEGLARVARHIILEFVARQPKVATEAYDYGLERHGIVRAELSPEYWIGRAEALTPKAGRKWLEAFLYQFSSHLQSKSQMTELSAALVRIEELLPTLTQRQRVPFITLYFLYNRIVPVENRAANFEATVQRYKDDIVAASPEALVTYLLGYLCGWPLERHRAQHDEYFEQRNRERGFRAPGLFEAGFSLALAESYRSAGLVEEAKGLISFAAENHPAMLAIHALETTFDPETPIDWGRLLLPGHPENVG